jgi:hypothetical protein
MKLVYGAAALSLALLAGPVPQPAFAFDQAVNNLLPRSGLDSLGLPISMPISGVFTIPAHTTEQLLSDEKHTDDIVAVMQLQALYEFYHDGNNGNAIAALFVPNGIFEDPYQDGEGHICGATATVAIGAAQIAAFFGNSPTPLPFTTHHHHVMTSEVVKVDNNGQFATFTANYLDDAAGGVTGVSGTTLSHVGEYIDDFVKLGGKWKFVHLRPLEDQLPAGQSCTN